MDNNKPGLIYGLLPKVMDSIGAVAKTSKNEQQNYKFRGIEAFYNAIHPALVKHGVFCCPQVLDVTSEDRLTSTGKPAIRVTMKVCHKFYAPDGSFVDVITCGEGIDSSDKATNKAMSAAMKYALIELFSVPTEDIEDGDTASPDAGAKPLPVERTTEDIPLRPVANGAFIDKEQAKKLHIRFKQELREELRVEADTLLYAFLADRNYIDADGLPSALCIPKSEFSRVGKEAVARAREL